jgi:hypothetical protein
VKFQQKHRNADYTALINTDYLPASKPLRPEASSNVPFSRDAKFVGRINIIADLEAKFSDFICHKRVALVGLGGMG